MSASDEDLRAKLNKFKACASSLQGRDLPPGVSEMLSKLSTVVSSVDSKLQSLSTAHDELHTEFMAKTLEFEEKLDKVSRRVGVKFPFPPHVSGGSASDAAASVVESAVSDEHTVVFGGVKQPLCMLFQFPFKIGDFYFDNLYQALHYIRLKFGGHAEIAAKLKAVVLGAVIDRVASEADDPEGWADKVKEICMALFHVKIKQSDDFEDAIASASADTEFVQCGTDMYYSAGVSYAMAMHELKKPGGSQLLKAKCKGKNMLGVWMKEFAEQYRLGLLPDSPSHDLDQYCQFGNVRLGSGAKVLMVTDVRHLAALQGQYSTELHVIFKGSIGEDEGQVSILGQLKDQLKNKIDEASVLVLMVGSFELLRPPDEVEERFSSFVKAVRELTDKPIYILNLLPRRDNVGDNVKLINYTMNIAVRNLDVKNVSLLDVNGKFPKKVDIVKGDNHLSAYYTRPPGEPSDSTSAGYELTTAGCAKVIEAICSVLPIVNLAVADQKGQQSKADEEPSDKKRKLG